MAGIFLKHKNSSKLGLAEVNFKTRDPCGETLTSIPAKKEEELSLRRRRFKFGVTRRRSRLSWRGIEEITQGYPGEA